MAKKKVVIQYFAMHDDGLKNGSFIRHSASGLAQYMNGDFMGFVDKVPSGFEPVDVKHAEKLLPKCCKPMKG